MSIASAVSKVQAVATNDTVARVVKTIIEVIAAQTALYTTVVPNPPNTQTSAAIAGGAGVLALVWNLLLKYASSVKSAKLDALAKAVDQAVDARLAAQAQVPQGNTPTA
jgi:hypothetical protein